MFDIKITTIEYDTEEEKQEKLKVVFAGMNEVMRDYTMRAARGECSWICASCSCSEQSGMPDECMHGHQDCTDIITRDKKAAFAMTQPKEWQ